MKNKNKEKWINDYSKAVKNFTFEHDPKSHLPFDAFCFYPLYFDLWLDKIYNAVSKINKKGASEEKILKSLPVYGSLKFIVYTIINMGAYYDYDYERMRTILDFFVKAMGDISKDDDIFNEFSIVLKSPAELEKELKGLDEIKKDDEKKIISRLIGVLALYNHALYNDYSTEYGYAIEGPYEKIKGLEKSESFLIRSFSDLNPVLLWPELKNFPLRNIKIFTVYENVKMKMRFVSTHIISTGNYQNRLEKYKVVINGRKIGDLEKIKTITQTIAEKTAEIYLKQKSLDFEKVKIRFLEQQAYELKGLFDLADMNWEPDKKILERIKNKKLKKEFIKMAYPRNKKEYEDYVGVTYLKKVYKLI